MKVPSPLKGNVPHALLSELPALFCLNQAEQVLRSDALSQDWERLTRRALERLNHHGDLSKYLSFIEQIPQSPSAKVESWGALPRVTADDSPTEQQQLRDALFGLKPWRKGPFSLCGVEIDSEWQCHLKWERLIRFASPLNGRKLLDVGAGNGYYLYRAHQEQVEFALGLEPSVLFCFQFLALQRLFRCETVGLLCLNAEEFTPSCQSFDTVLSMGVLYHRRSPLDHLLELKGFLRSGGELVVETLVVAGPEGHCLLPEGRYAQMRNVWFLPTVATLVSWFRRLAFVSIEVDEVVTTTSAEQRASSWSTDASLKDFLDPLDPSRTVEGHPAPKRVLIKGIAP
jgi:tRNA (mo5U34)-methyltransferase